MTANSHDPISTPSTARRGSNTATRILDSAEKLVQTRGFNGFSYADVAAELGVTKASLHYHFAGKTELAQALITRYAERFSAALEQIETRLTAGPAKLAAEYGTLPEPLRERVIAFFDDNEAWLEHVLEQGRADGSLRVDAPPRETA